MDSLTITPAGMGDVADSAELRHALWPDASVDEHAGEARAALTGGATGLLPSMVLIARLRDQAAGFIEVGLR